MYEVRPVQGMAELRYLYPMIEAACGRIEARESARYFAPQVYADVVAGQLVLFAVLDGPEHVGLFLCRKLELSRATRPRLLIDLAYTEARHPDADGIMQAGLDTCMEYARQLGCCALRFHGVRRGWAKRAARWGYQPVETVYERALT